MTLMDSPMITEMCITAWSFVRTTIETHHTEFHRCYWSSLSPTKVSHFCVLMRKKMEVDEWSKRRTKNGKEWCGKKEEEVKTPASLDGKKTHTFFFFFFPDSAIVRQTGLARILSKKGSRSKQVATFHKSTKVRSYSFQHV